MEYRRLTTALEDKGRLIPVTDSPSQHGAKLGTPYKEYYTSIYKYGENHHQQFLKTGSVKGIFDLVIDRLVFDFDGKLNKETPAPELALSDTIEVCNRLLSFGIEEKDLRIAFSGACGFHVEVYLEEDLTESEFKLITRNIANGLNSFDSKICNPSRIFRVVGSVNLKTGLYKVPLTFSQLKSLSISEIQEKAKSLHNVKKEDFNWEVIKLPESIKKLTEVKEKKVVNLMDLGELNIDFTKKVKGWSNCKWALTQGVGVKPGDRHEQLLCIAATARALNYTSEQAFYLAKNAMKLGVKRYGGEKCEDGDIGRDVNSVYAESWLGGTFSCRDGKTQWLTDFCHSLGKNKCKHNEDESCFIEMDDFAHKFTDFAVNIDKNTLKLGVPPIDEKVMITTSMLVGLLGAPSTGKTTLLLNFLEQSNKDKIESVFFSMDMGLPLVYLRLIQKHFGIQKDQVFDMFLNDPSRVQNIIQTIKDKYTKTKFSFKTGLTVEGMKNAVLDHQDRTGNKVKLIGVDYLECISGEFSDATANTALIANQLKDIANDLDVCVMLLLQTQKQSGDPSDSLLSMRNVKGSSVVEQACSVILSMSRPGFSPLTPENDIFTTISTVKDRMGSLMSIDCGWNGLTGSIYALPDEHRVLLNQIREAKKAEKQAKDTW